MMIVVFAVVLVIVVAVLGIYAYYGGFAKIDIKQESLGGETIVYQEVQGDYKQTMVASNEIYYYLLNDLKIETFEGIGIFYDNPQEVEKDKLRSEVGCIIEAKDIERLRESGCKYKIKTLSVKPTIVVEFPFKGQMSIFVGMFKIYPAIEKYIQKYNLPKDGPLIEIYDTPNKKTTYRKVLGE